MFLEWQTSPETRVFPMLLSLRGQSYLFRSFCLSSLGKALSRLFGPLLSLSLLVWVLVAVLGQDLPYFGSALSCLVGCLLYSAWCCLVAYLMSWLEVKWFCSLARSLLLFSSSTWSKWFGLLSMVRDLSVALPSVLTRGLAPSVRRLSRSVNRSSVRQHALFRWWLLGF